jgi:cytochrome c oxidase subunit I+III
VGAVPFDWQAHDSYFVVAHLHYVLIGGVVFPIFSAIYYWMPKFNGKLLNETLGKWNFWLMFVGFHVAFFPQHILGLWGMPRRYYTYPAEFGWEFLNLISTVGAFMLAAGVAVFIVNFFYSSRHGEDAGPNPWGGSSLEWAADSPPINYGFGVLPIVRGRDPLWDQSSLTEGPERIRSLVQDLARWPTSWRAALVTSSLDGRPEEVFRVSGPSLWPFVTGVGLVTIFGTEIFSLRPVSLLGIIILIVGIVGWHWPSKVRTTQAEAEAFEAKHGIPVRPHGSEAVNRGAIRLFILLLGIALGCFLLSYFYIRVENPTWPLDGLPLPSLTWIGLATACLLLNGAVMAWSFRKIRHGEVGTMRWGLLGGMVLQAAALGLLIFELSQLSFDWRVNAYASLFWSLDAYLLLLLLIGLGMSLFVFIGAWRGIYDTRCCVPIENTTYYWLALIVMWLITVGVVYVYPYGV